jgi:hypothetical protein
MEDPSISRWTVHLQKWPRDVNLRAGMLTGVWSDVAGLVSSRDAAVFDAQGAQIPPNEFLRRLTEEDSDPLFASVRWAVWSPKSRKKRIKIFTKFFFFRF